MTTPEFLELVEFVESLCKHVKKAVDDKTVTTYAPGETYYTKGRREVIVSNMSANCFDLLLLVDRVQVGCVSLHRANFAQACEGWILQGCLPTGTKIV